jgi:O-antigen/teichoic acid export membrane protein
VRTLAARIVSNTAVQVAGSSVNTLLGLVIAGTLSRHLGVAGYGEYALVLVYLAFAGIVSSLGVDVLLVREMSAVPEDDAERVGRLVSSAIVMRLGLAVAAVLLLAAALALTGASREFTTAMLVAAVSLVAGAFDSIGAVFRTRLAMSPLVGVAVAAQAVHLVLVLAVVLWPGGLVAVVGVYVLAIAVRLAGQWTLSRRLLAFRFDPDPVLVRRLLREAAPFGLAAALWIVYYRIDAAMLEWMHGLEAVAMYSVAYKFVDLVLQLSGMCMTSLSPLLSRRSATDLGELRRFAQNALDYLAILGAAVGVGLFVGAPVVVPVVFGAAFEPAVTTLRILAPMGLLVFCNNLFGHLFVALHATGRPLIAFRLLAVAASILFNVLLIPRWGADGAAVATVAGEAFALVVAPCILAGRLGGAPRFRTFAHALVVFAGGVALAVALPPSLLGGLVAFGAFAVAMAVVARERFGEIAQLMGSPSPGR